MERKVTQHSSSHLIKVASVQYRSGPDPEANMARAYHLAKHMSYEGPDIIVLPEHTFFLSKLGEFHRFAKNFEDHPWIHLLQNWAVEFQSVIVAGSLPEPSPDNKIYQTAVVTFPDERQPLFFRKHMLFRGIARNTELDESTVVSRGDAPYLCFNVKDWRVGLTLCAELRYSFIFHGMRYRDQCDIALVPASFYASTGKYHFLPLLRSRAIEFQMVVVSANQSSHPGEAKPVFIGQSCIIDPWGEVLSLAGVTGDALCFQELSQEKIQEVRSRVKMNVATFHGAEGPLMPSHP